MLRLNAIQDAGMSMLVLAESGPADGGAVTKAARSSCSASPLDIRALPSCRQAGASAAISSNASEDCQTSLLAGSHRTSSAFASAGQSAGNSPTNGIDRMFQSCGAHTNSKPNAKPVTPRDISSHSSPAPADLVQAADSFDEKPLSAAVSDYELNMMPSSHQLLERANSLDTASACSNAHHQAQRFVDEIGHSTAALEPKPGSKPASRQLLSRSPELGMASTGSNAHPHHSRHPIDEDSHSNTALKTESGLLPPSNQLHEIAEKLDMAAADNDAPALKAAILAAVRILGSAHPATTATTQLPQVLASCMKDASSHHALCLLRAILQGRYVCFAAWMVTQYV